MSARGILVLVIAMGAAAAATYYVMKNPDVSDVVSRSLNLAPATPSTPSTSPTQPAVVEAPVVRRDADGFLVRAGKCEARPIEEAGGRVVGGGFARIGNWPGFVSLRLARKLDNGKSDYAYFCGGTLISPNWVVTAAHCIWDDGGELELKEEAAGKWVQRRNNTQLQLGGQLEVVVGREKLTDDSAETVLQIADVIVHEKYEANPSPLRGNDIALIKLKSPYKGEIMRMSVSAAADPSDENGTNMYVAGFGLAEVDQSRKLVAQETSTKKNVARAYSHRLKENYVPVTTEADCKNSMGSIGTISSEQLCAGYTKTEGEDSCNGDSGGPLARLDSQLCPVLVGIVSWGTRKCGTQSRPAIYTRVSQFYPWIKEKTGNAKVAAVAKSGDMAPLDPVIQAVSAMSSRSVSGGSASVVVTTQPDPIALNEYKSVNVTAKGISGHVVLIDVDSKGGLYYLIPNGDHKFEPPFINDGQTLTFGDGANGTRRFQAACPDGEGRVVAIVSPDRTLWKRLKDKLKTRDPDAVGRGLALEKKGDMSLLDMARDNRKEVLAIGAAAYSITPDASCAADAE